MSDRLLAITIDTEVDKGPGWVIKQPPSFASVSSGISEILSPLFDRFGAIPTYLLSAEVMEDDGSVDVLRALGARAELGTHLHSEFVAPGRTLDRANMGGALANEVQRALPLSQEAAKLDSLTQLFEERFGKRPRSFRAGRYGIRGETFGLLAERGYVVDSSVTPGLLWPYPEGALDFRHWRAGPTRVETESGGLIELPVSIRPGGRAAHWVQRMPGLSARAARLLLRDSARFLWLRPTWESADSLIDYVTHAPERIFVLMFHSMEVVPGASPYAASADECGRIVGALEGLLRHCADRGIACVGLTDAALSV